MWVTIETRKLIGKHSIAVTLEDEDFRKVRPVPGTVVRDISQVEFQVAPNRPEHKDWVLLRARDGKSYPLGERLEVLEEFTVEA